MARKKQKSQNTNDWINPFYEEKTVFYENDLQAAKDRVASILGKNYVSEGNGIGNGSFDAYPEGDRYKSFEYEGEKYDRIEVFYMPKSPTIRGYRVRLAKFNPFDGFRDKVSHSSVKAGDVVYYIPEGRRCTVAYKDAATRIVKLKSEDGRAFFLLKSDFDNGDVLKVAAPLSGAKSYDLVSWTYHNKTLEPSKPTYHLRNVGIKEIKEFVRKNGLYIRSGKNALFPVWKKKGDKRDIYYSVEYIPELAGIEDVAQIAANAYVQKARIDYEKSLTPEERKELAAQRTNNLTKSAMLLVGAGIGFAVGKFI